MYMAIHESLFAKRDPFLKFLCIEFPNVWYQEHDGDFDLLKFTFIAQALGSLYSITRVPTIAF